MGTFRRLAVFGVAVLCASCTSTFSYSSLSPNDPIGLGVSRSFDSTNSQISLQGMYDTGFVPTLQGVTVVAEQGGDEWEVFLRPPLGSSLAVRTYSYAPSNPTPAYAGVTVFHTLGGLGLLSCSPETSELRIDSITTQFGTNRVTGIKGAVYHTSAVGQQVNIHFDVKPG